MTARTNPLDPSHLPSILTTLTQGSLELIGQVLWGSNYTFLAQVGLGNEAVQAIYKPARGERPLWDFPHGTLAHREVAAFRLSQALGWGLVPPTVLRQDAPEGPGSLQLYIHADPQRHYFSLEEAQKQRLRPVALFDLLINNADRKAGHLLFDANDHLWLIDHGVSFHTEYKLRTVIWDFIGERIPPDLIEDLRRLLRTWEEERGIHRELEGLLSEHEIRALRSRAERLLHLGTYPEPQPGRPYPWPLI
ncbi:MAG TPA: SCO1664 family protein [Chloroflexi bacterium]|nr:SCO1664 family protein [Chloroflexota bacterium]